MLAVLGPQVEAFGGSHLALGAPMSIMAFRSLTSAYLACGE